jgi:hypothetical protein
LEVACPNPATSAHEFAVGIKTNANSSINYGERFTVAERISSCLAEPAVNAVIRKRFDKRRQMQRTKRAAHLLPRQRTRTLDGLLRPPLER